MEAGYRGLRITKLGEEKHEASIFEVFLDASAERQRWSSPLHIWIRSSLPSGICSSTVLAQTGREMEADMSGKRRSREGYGDE